MPSQVESTGLVNVNRTASEKCPFVDIIVPFYDVSSKQIHNFVSSIERQTYQRDRFRLFLVDNDMVPLDVEPIATDIEVHVLHTVAPGSYAARNQGVAHSGGDVLLFTDIDCVPDKHWVENIVDVLMESASSSVVVAGRICVYCKDGVHATPCEDFDRRTHLRQKRYAKQGYAATANLATWRSFFLAVGGFDARLMSGGDEQWCRRAVSAGADVVYAEDAIVFHPARGSFAQLARKNRRGCGGRYVLLRSQGGPTAFKCIAGEFEAMPSRWNRLREDGIRTSSMRKLQLAGLFIAVEAVRFLEYARLGLGGVPERR